MNAWLIILTVYLCVWAPYCYCAKNIEDTGFNYDAKGKRDPFMPLIGQERSDLLGLESVVSPGDLKLEGIATGAGGKQIAILNGHMVKEKDRFGALLIKKISRKQVEFSIEERDYTLTLQESSKEHEVNKE